MTQCVKESEHGLWLALGRKLFVFIAFCIALNAQAGIAGTATEPAVATSEAEQIVQRLEDALLEAMKLGDQTGFDSRFNTIEPIVREDFDMTMISRLVLGRHWTKLSAADRAKFVDTFTQYVISDYASEFDHYNDQQFEILSVKEQRAGVAIVSSQLLTKSGKTHRFDYQLRKTHDRWHIVNIAVDGVSDLAMKRSQYTSVIKKDGFAALLDTLESRIRDYAEGRDEDS